MAKRAPRRGDSIKCTKHDGKHRGTVATVIMPGVMYTVTWHGKGAPEPVRVGTVTLRYPKEIVQHHLFDLTACEAEAIELV